MRRLSIAVVQLVVFLGLLELGFRIYNPFPFRVRGSRIVLPVRQSYTFEIDTRTPKLDRIAHHRKNSLGFRGPDPPADLSRRPSVVTIGGSTTECLFLSDGKTWTDELARRNTPRWPAAWVNNAGLDGQSTYGHLILLRDVVVGLKPAFAVFLVGVNDVGRDDATSFDASLAPGSGLRQRATAYAVDHSETLALVQNLARARRAQARGFGHSEMDVRTLRELKLDPSAVTAAVAQHDRYLPAYGQRLAAIIALCRDHGIEPILLTQPALYGDVVDPSTGVDLGTRQFTGRGNGDVEWKVLERYNDVTRAVAAARQVPLVDLARLVPKDSRYFYDHLHYSLEGARLVGDLVADGITPALSRRF